MTWPEYVAGHLDEIGYLVRNARTRSGAPLIRPTDWEDAIQHAALRLLTFTPKHDHPAARWCALQTAVRFACFDWVERRSKHDPVVGSTDETTIHDTGEAVPRFWRSEGEAAHPGPEHTHLALLDAADQFKQMAPPRRKALALHVEGHTADEIAPLLETTPGNVYQLVCRARRELAA